MSELDKLEQYLKEHGYSYERTDRLADENVVRIYREMNNGEYRGQGEFHQIVVYDRNDEFLFDVVCHYGSYGWEVGLLEFLGSPITGSYDPEGYLTAKDVIKRLKRVQK